LKLLANFHPTKSLKYQEVHSFELKANQRKKATTTTTTICRDGSSFMWHQPCQRGKYTTLVDIQKRTIKSYSLM